MILIVESIPYISNNIKICNIIANLNGAEKPYSVSAFLYNLMRKEQCIDDIMQLCVDVLIIELYAKGK